MTTRLAAITALTFISAAAAAQVTDTFLLSQPIYTYLPNVMQDSDKVYNVIFTNAGTLPEELTKLPNLRSLVLNGNDWDYEMKELPAYISDLKQLEHFEIYNTDVLSLPPQIKGLTHLRSLIAYDITSIPPETGDLSELELLCIPNVKKLPTTLSKLEKLKQLQVTDATLPVIKNLAELRTSPLTILRMNDPGEFASLQKLILYFPYNYSHNRVLPPDSTNTLLEKISRLPQLKELDVSQLYLTPEAWKIITGMKQLTSLLLGESNSVVPASITELTNLQRISFSPGDSASCEYLAQLPHLTKADILFDVTPYVAKLKKIKSLNLHTGSLDEQRVQVLSQLPELKEIAWDDIWIHYLYAELGQLTNLQSVDLSHANGLLSYDEYDHTFTILGMLPNLQTLTLYDTQLRTDPPTDFSKMRSLKTLRLYRTGYWPKEDEDLLKRSLPASCKLVYMPEPVFRE